MRRLIFATVVIAAPLLLIGATPASACGWYGYRSCGCYAPRAYSYSYYRPAYFYRSYYRPAYAYAGFHRPRVWGGAAWGWRGWRRW